MILRQHTKIPKEESWQILEQSNMKTESINVVSLQSRFDKYVMIMSVMSWVSFSFRLVARGRSLHFPDFVVDDGEDGEPHDVEELK